MSTANRILELRTKRNLTQKEFADGVKINRSVINRIEKGTRPIRDDELKIIANYFSVSTDYLLGNDAKSPLFTEKQTELINGYENLNDEGQNMLLGILASLQQSHAKTAIN